MSIRCCLGFHDWVVLNGENDDYRSLYIAGPPYGGSLITELIYQRVCIRCGKVHDRIKEYDDRCEKEAKAEMKMFDKQAKQRNRMLTRRRKARKMYENVAKKYTTDVDYEEHAASLQSKVRVDNE